MPVPKPGEKQSDYISRCVEEVMGEGKSREEALGKCYGMWKFYTEKRNSNMARSSNMETIVFNLDTKLVQEDTMDGRVYFVAPVVLMTEGVHNGSLGPLFYSASELEKWTPSWNHKPIVINHPADGNPCTKDYLKTNKIGFILNAKWDGKQRAEAWIDKSKSYLVDKRVYNAVQSGKIMEVSTGLYIDFVPSDGDWNGEKYIGAAVNHRPDHLAVLPDSVGACSVADGAGLLQVNKNFSLVKNNVDGSLLGVIISDKIKDYLISDLLNYNICVALNDLLLKKNDGCDIVLEDIVSNCVIYRKGRDLYNQQFIVDNNKVELIGSPCLVDRIIVYNKRKESSVSKADLVANLVGSDLLGLSDDDKTWLDSLTEEQLSKLVPNSDAIVFKNKDDLDKFVDEKVKQAIESYKETISKTNNTSNNQKKTVQEYLNDMPDELRSIYNEAMAALNHEKQLLIDAVVSNKNNKFTKDELARMNLDTLRKLASIAVSEDEPVIKNNFIGLGLLPVNLSKGSTDDLLAVPSYDDSKFKR